MRALIFSDIHDNIAHVRALRAKVENEFDFIIVAGDIGDEIINDFVEIIDTFACPAFIVYGNWDNKAEYDSIKSKNCVLLNHNIAKIGDLYISGFSGCPTSWGKNPVHVKNQAAIKANHSKILEDLTKGVETYKAEKAALEILNLEEINNFNSNNHPTEKGYKSKLRLLQKKQEKESSILYKKVENIRASKEYKKYLKDYEKSYHATIRENRRILFETIKANDIPPEKLILVTHERMYKIAEEGITPLLHIFGHVHEYKLTYYKGTWYLNAAALDNETSESLASLNVEQLEIERELQELFGVHDVQHEGYCTIEFEGTTFSVERHKLFEND